MKKDEVFVVTIGDYSISVSAVGGGAYETRRQKQDGKTGGPREHPTAVALTNYLHREFEAQFSAAGQTEAGV